MKWIALSCSAPPEKNDRHSHTQGHVLENLRNNDVSPKDSELNSELFTSPTFSTHSLIMVAVGRTGYVLVHVQGV